MIKYSLIKSFTLFSFITFILIGIVLSSVISIHIRDDKYANLKEVTQVTIDSITGNSLIESDFDGIISDSKKSNIEESIKELMSFYKPKSIVLYNSKKAVILSSGLPTDVLKNVNLDNVGKVLNSNVPFAISKVSTSKSLAIRQVKSLCSTYMFQ